MNRLRAATVAVACGSAQRPLPLPLLLLLKLLLTWVPVDGATSPVPKSDKKRLLFERSELQTLPDFGAGDVGTPRSGAPSSGSPSLAYFSWRSKRSRSAAGPRPGLVVWQAQQHCFIRQRT